MNTQDISKTVITVAPHDYLHFVIKGTKDEAVVERVARQDVGFEIVCRVNRYVWDKFQVQPYDVIFQEAVRREMRQEYHSNRTKDNHPSLETLKSHVLERLGDSLWEYKEAVQHHEQLMLEVETTHNVNKLLPHLIREFGLDHGNPIEQIVTQLIFLLHPELFEDETAGES